MVGGAQYQQKDQRFSALILGQSWSVRSPHGVAEQISCGCRCAGILVDAVAICPGEGQPRAQDDSPRGEENVCFTTEH